MTQKELRKLNRKQLLELLLVQTQRADQLQEKLDSLETQLSQRTIVTENAEGTTDTPLQLNGIFEAAKSAADLYLENIRKQEDQCAQMEADARQRADTIIQEAEQRSVQIQKDADAHWKQMEQRIKEYFQLMNDLHHKDAE